MKGLDVGTGNMIAMDAEGTRLQRNAFLTVDQTVTTTRQLQLMGVPFVKLDNRLHIVGRQAYEYANIFNSNELRRPMAQGLLNPTEQDAFPILKVIIENLLGIPKEGAPIEKVIYTVPGKPIDKDKEIDYHEDVLAAIIRKIGYEPRALNEGIALGNAGLADNRLTGITISMGAGMCLRGDTKIPLLNGEIKTIKELADAGPEKEFWVYSCKEDGQIVPGKAHNAHQVKTSKLLRLWFDNEQYLDCTPDHKIMLRDGSYKEAKDLIEGESLMPLYTRSKEIDGRPGYVEVRNNKTGRFNSVHRLVYSQHMDKKLDKDDIIHHIDCVPNNNFPSNLQITNRAEHQLIHQNLCKWVKNNLKGKTYEECFGEEKAKEIKDKQSKVRKAAGPNAGTFVKEHAPHNKGLSMEELYGLKQAVKIKEKIAKSTKKAMQTPEVIERMKRGYEKRSACANNHKLVSIEELNIEEDVYDISVDKYHNFAIDSGIFVHNCNIAIMYAGLSNLHFSVARGGDWIDENVARDCGITRAKATTIKETANYSISPKYTAARTREQQAIKSYYEVLIRYLLANIANQFAKSAMPQFPDPIPIVIGGGTCMVEGFIEVFKEQFQQKQFPIDISHIKIVDEPLMAVARGCYLEAQLEEE